MTDLKTTAGKIEDLDNRLSEARTPMGADIVEVLHAAGHLSARERVEKLVDEGTFVEMDALARHRSTAFGREHDRPYTDGIVTGYGVVDKRKVCVFSQDATVFGGTQGEVYAEKLTKLYDLALKTGVPIIGLYDSTGPRVQEGIATLAGYARIMARVTAASGLIPQIGVVLGDTAGIAAFAPTLSDVLIITEGATLHQAAGHVADADVESFGGAAVHAAAGTAQLVAADEEEALSLARDVLSFLPANNRAEAPRSAAEVATGAIADNITERDRALDVIIPDGAAEAYDMRDVIATVVDEGSFFELSASTAENILTGFAHIEGRAVGIVANQPLALAGALDAAAAEKAARFIRTCDAFNTPVIEFVDSPGFVPTSEEEKAGLVRRASKLAFAFAETTVGTLTVITRKAIGPAYVFMGSKDLGADLVYAWPTAEIAVTQASQAALAIYGEGANPDNEAELAAQFLHPYAAAENGLVDNVIEPSATRGYLIEGLRLLERKVVAQLPKKHGNITL
ncbi:acyl-CoA carboxylase subunit beta [Corynebacterium flavescens]|uniref:acyl-CoA carboxylase subunit beta n=1 Tax=Corynebacterium flavescens TaxID=28028 RepID=UPI003FD0F7BF